MTRVTAVQLSHTSFAHLSGMYGIFETSEIFYKEFDEGNAGLLLVCCGIWGTGCIFPAPAGTSVDAP